MEGAKMIRRHAFQLLYATRVSITKFSSNYSELFHHVVQFYLYLKT